MSSLDTTELLKSLSQQNTRKMVRARTHCVGVGGEWWVLGVVGGGWGGGGGRGLRKGS